MSRKSTIEWTNSTWNPVTGCTKVSAGCDHCYAERLSERFRGVKGHPFETGFDLTLRPERLEQPKHWRRPQLIFVNSMSDMFHKDIPTQYIHRVFDTIEAGGLAHLSSADQTQFADARFCLSTLWKPVRPVTYLARCLYRRHRGHDAPAAFETDQSLNALCFIRTVARCAWFGGSYGYSLGNRWGREPTRSASGQDRVVA